MKKKLSWFLIIIGLLIIAYPTVDKLYSQYEQNKYLKQLENADTDALQDYEGLDESFSTGDEEEPSVSPSPGVSVTEGTVSPTAVPTKKPSTNTGYKAIGILKISKIKLNLPILYGTSYEAMKIGAGQVKGTSKIGEVGNCVLASHRSHSYGKLFSRLNELKAGDEIVIVVGEKTYKYKVYNTMLVLPTDVSVLKKSDTEKILTLVTCDPATNPTHRLIIQAKSL